MKKTVLIILLLLSSIHAYTQDTLFKKIGDPLICKVIEIGEDEVKYKNIENPDGPDYVIAVSKLRYIKFANGKEHRFEDSQTLLSGPDQKTISKKNAIKLAPFSPLFGKAIIGFEHVQKFGLNWEAEVGFIGFGNPDRLNNSEKGVWLYAGPKLLFRKDTYTKGERHYHALHGAYFRPQLGFEYQTGEERRYSNQYDLLDIDYTLYHFGLMLNIGKQWLLADILTLDIWCGLGMASNHLKHDKEISNIESFWFDPARTHSVLSGSGGNGKINLSANAGFKVGVIF